MHTDEFEISIGREIRLCRKLIWRLKRSIEKKEKRYGISTEDFIEGLNQGRLLESSPDFANWQSDCRELADLERMLGEYQEQLRKLE